MRIKSELADAREVLLEMDKLVAALREENERLKGELEALRHPYEVVQTQAPWHST